MRPLRVVGPNEPERSARELGDDADASDEELVAQLVAGQERAIAFLYHRYSNRIYNMAAQTLDRPGAEEIAQDVMLTVWRKAATYDPARGPFRPWVMRIAQLRIINELRRRSRRPITTTDAGGDQADRLVDARPQPDAAALGSLRDATIRDALDSLPAPQRNAVRLAFLEDLTQEQTARATDTPLGTTKTRIRAGLRTLRRHTAILALVSACVLAIAIASTVVTRSRSHAPAAQRSDRALHMLAASDMTVRRLLPPALRASGVAIGDPSMHAAYRSRPGSPTAVLTLSHFSQPLKGLHLIAWIRHGTSWRQLQSLSTKPDGTALAVVESPDLTTAPDGIEVTLEPNPATSTPSTQVIVTWPTDPVQPAGVK